MQSIFNSPNGLSATIEDLQIYLQLSNFSKLQAALSGILRVRGNGTGRKKTTENGHLASGLSPLKGLHPTNTFLQCQLWQP